VCSAVGRTEWNWRDDPQLHLVSETERRLRLLRGPYSASDVDQHVSCIAQRRLNRLAQT